MKFEEKRESGWKNEQRLGEVVLPEVNTMLEASGHLFHFGTTSEEQAHLVRGRETRRAAAYEGK